MVLGHHAQSHIILRHVIICSLMTNKKHFISNSKSPMDTKLGRVVAYDTEKTLKKLHQKQ